MLRRRGKKWISKLSEGYGGELILRSHTKTALTPAKMAIMKKNCKLFKYYIKQTVVFIYKNRSPNFWDYPRTYTNS